MLGELIAVCQSLNVSILPLSCRQSKALRQQALKLFGRTPLPRDAATSVWLDLSQFDAVTCHTYSYLTLGAPEIHWKAAEGAWYM